MILFSLLIWVFKGKKTAHYWISNSLIVMRVVVPVGRNVDLAAEGTFIQLNLAICPHPAIFLTQRALTYLALYPALPPRLDVRTNAVVASSFGVLTRRESEDATYEGLKSGSACGYDTQIHLDKSPELDIICAILIVSAYVC